MVGAVPILPTPSVDSSGETLFYGLNIMKKLLYGVGINDADYDVNPTINGKWIWCPFYTRWLHMIQRCYDNKKHIRSPTYASCTVDTVWHSFMTFKAWMGAQDWMGKELDKDLLVSGNKVYGPDTCLFVHQGINKLLNTCNASRGEWPIGVCLNRRKKKYIAAVGMNGKSERLGYFASRHTKPTKHGNVQRYRSSESLQMQRPTKD